MSITVDVLQYGTGSHTTPSEAGNFVATDFVADGIVGAVAATSGVAPMTGGFAANAQGTPDMTVAVTAGVAYVTGTPTSQNSQRLRVKLNANQNVTISANSTGGTRFDWIYIKLDPTNMANPNTAADNVATLVVSRSTSSSVDNGTPPTYGYCIAKVTVTNGASSITNGNIADARSQTSAAVVPAQVITGMPVQVVTAAFTAVATGTTLVPSDDTIPQNTEGDQYMTLAITPKSATNILVVEAVSHVSHSVSTTITSAIYQDSTANALAANSTFQGTGTGRVTIPTSHTMTAGTTAATTFKVRIGGANAGTTTFNGSAAARVYGGITGSMLKITEYKV